MRRLVALVALCLAINPAVKPNQYANQTNTASNQEREPPVVVLNNQKSSAKTYNDPQESPKWYRTVNWSNWALVVVAFFTGFAVLKQARDTARAAKAAEEAAEASKRNSDILINAERAWLHVEIISDTLERRAVSTFPVFPVNVRNYGRTVGELIEYRRAARKVGQIEQLLHDPGEKVPLLDTGRRFIAPGEIGEKVFSIDMDKTLESFGIFDESGRTKAPVNLLIKILYCDVLDRKNVRSSRFVYRYDPAVARLTLWPEYTEYA